jgi:3-hydroxybutyrate dehydrogenase
MREAGTSMLVFSMQTCASLAAITAMMDAIETRGAPAILVNNAGIQQTVTLAEVTQEIWDDILAVTLSGALHTMRRALPVRNAATDG